MARQISIGLFLLLALAVLPTRGQDRPQTNRYSFDFRGETLADALETVARKTGMDIVYDPGLVEGIHVFKRIKKKTAADLISTILKDKPLDYITLSTGTLVIIRAIKGAPAYGSYYGKVVDRHSGEPLPGASVILADASGGTSAGPSGSFAFNRLVSGSYRLIFSYVGYEPVFKTIHVQPDSSLRDRVSLKPRPVLFTPIVVTGHRPLFPLNTGYGQSVQADTDWAVTGKMRDPIRSLSLFTGVQSGISLTDLHLQGGRRGDHRILLDEVPVYNPFSFGQMFSAFSPYAIGTVEVHKAGYGVTQGSQMAGFVNLQHDLEGVDRHSALFQADPLSVNMRGNLFFPDNDKTANEELKMMAAGRTNFWDLYQEPTLARTLRSWDNLDPLVTRLLITADKDPSRYEPVEHRSAVRFHDIHLAARYTKNDYTTIETSFYVGENFVQTDLLRRAPQDQELPPYLFGRDAYRWKNFMGQLTYTSMVTSRLDLESKISFTSNKLDQRYLIGTSKHANLPDIGIDGSTAFAVLNSAAARDELPTQHNRNEIGHFIYRTDAAYHLSPSINIEAGLKMDAVNSKVALSDLFYLPTESSQQSVFYSGYLNGNWQFGQYWKVSGGSRLTYDPALGQWYTEPRSSIQYDHSPSEQQNSSWSARISGGLYRQYINQYDISNPGPTALVPSLTIWSHASGAEKPKAWHLSGSFRHHPAPHTSLELELFHKWQPTMYTASYRNLITGTSINRSSLAAFAEKTRMKSAGAGLRLTQTVSNPAMHFILGYDYSYNRMEFPSQFGRTLPPPWNEPHRLQLRMLWQPSSTITAVAKWMSIYGRSWGFRPSYYNFLLFRSGETYGDFTFNSPEDDRLEPFHQLDLSLIYRPSFPALDAELRLDLINVLNRHNTIDWSLESPDGGITYEKVKRTMPGLSPSLSIQIGI